MLSINVLDSEFNIPILAIRLGEEVVEFDAYKITKRASKLENVYDSINQYLDQLPNERKTKFYNLLDDVLLNSDIKVNNAGYMTFLRDIINDATIVFGFDEFKEWFRKNHNGLKIPPKIPDVYEENPDKRKTTSKTYVLHEYVDFIALVLYYRAMLPFYIDFLSYCSDVSLHPYLQIFRLFEHGPAHGPEFIKLEEYMTINHKLTNGRKSREKIVVTAGLAEDDVVNYFISETIFKKVLMMDFFKVDTNPIAYGYQTIIYSGIYKNNATTNLKTFDKTKLPQDEEHPFFEQNRKSTNLPMGVVVELQWALSHRERLLVDLGYDVSKFRWDQFEKEMEHVELYMSKPVDLVQMYLLGWFLKSIVNPRALFYLEQRDIVELMLLVKICLINDGQDFIGGFLTCIQDKEANFINTGIMVKGSLSKHLSKELNSLFNYSIDDKGVEYEKIVIDTSKHISNLVWRPTGIINPRYVNESGFLINPSDITEVVVDYIKYILKLGRKSYETKGV